LYQRVQLEILLSNIPIVKQSKGDMAQIRMKMTIRHRIEEVERDSTRLSKEDKVVVNKEGKLKMTTI
jgi:hypothetical protein